jgi:hypothetical protein
MTWAGKPNTWERRCFMDGDCALRPGTSQASMSPRSTTNYTLDPPSWVGQHIFFKLCHNNTKCSDTVVKTDTGFVILMSFIIEQCYSGVLHLYSVRNLSETQTTLIGFSWVSTVLPGIFRGISSIRPLSCPPKFFIIRHPSYHPIVYIST